MPLLDHFHAPVFPRHPWESFHVVWASELLTWLNRTLPRRYFATVHTHLGSQVEADVAEFELPSEPAEEEVNGPGGGVAVQTWAPPAVAMVMPAIFPDDMEVQVFDERADARLVAVVELVSPRNKDRPESRRAFAAKCAAYLERGIGLVTVDIVTRHHFNTHNELVELLRLDEGFRMAATASLSAVAYRPARREEKNEIDVWPVELNVTYNDARQSSRL
jgi:hypothetical protein